MFERGFKSWCENVALQQRRALRLRPADPLDPTKLAQHLGVEVWTPERIPGLEPSVLKTLLHEDPDSWSAVTLSVGTKDVIILNSAHSGGRPASDLAHELAHILIGHRPARVDVSADGLLLLNTYDRSQEEEARWLAGCLLLPRPALLAIVRLQSTWSDVQERYGVSREMFEYRLNITGVLYQVKRGRKLLGGARGGRGG